MKRIIIGLTGPIASGKDVAAKYFSRHGALVINADKLGHDIYRSQSKVWHMIVRTFGAKVLKRGGAVNRRKLANVVFSDKKALNKLNMITHPEIKKLIVAIIKTTPIKRKIVINAALLKEMKLIPLVDKVITVISKEKIRLKRLAGSGIKKNDALARMRAQKTAAGYVGLADIVITNNGTIDQLRNKIKKLIEYL